LRPFETPSVWLFYSVAAGLGLAFLATLLYLAWGSAIENEIRDFEFETLALNDTLAANARAVETHLDGLGAFLEAEDARTDREFTAFVQRLLASTDFIRGAGVYRAQAAGYALVQAAGRAVDRLPRSLEFETALTGAMELAFETGDTIPAPVAAGERDNVPYLALRPLRAPGGRAFVALAVDSQRLLGEYAAQGNLAIDIYVESSGVLGRQRVYGYRPRAWGQLQPGRIDTLLTSNQLRFDQYSMRLRAERPLYWRELDKALLFAAALLGVGVTLLLVALARAKELQMRELRARNRVIEETVTRQTKELAEARDQALAASRVKSDFLASMSHEIRTPLNAIIGMAELLSETRLSVEQTKYVDIFRKSGEALLALVNDILDLSKIEAGQLVLELVDFDLRELIEHAVDLYALKTDEKGIELAAHIAPDVPRYLKGDPTRLRQIVLNLIGNAIKFTEQGEIVVRVARDPAQPRADGRLRFSVADTGIGIPQDKLEAIFGSFTQVDSSTTRKYGGTGLGLTISRSLAQLMGGRMWVESEVGRGSTFFFTAGFGPGTAPPLPAPARQVSLRGRRILIVDDNETNLVILREMLSGEGAEVDECAGGREALQRYRAAGELGRPYELVLLDCRMPEMDGFEVAEQITALGGQPGALMMLTSSNLTSDLERARSLKLDGYLVKPVKRAELLEAIARALESTELAVGSPVSAGLGADSSPGAEVSAAPGRKRAGILLVEDNPDNRLLIEAYLKREPYSIDTAENGAMAVERFKAGVYDVVLMDVQMPVMDGHDATRAIRAWEREQNRKPARIIALTAHAMREEIDKSIAAGCDAHLTKPIKKQALLIALAGHLADLQPRTPQPALSPQAERGDC
jgi:signal transduction histidine kinase/CheY-like chemotaxis protein